MEVGSGPKPDVTLCVRLGIGSRCTIAHPFPRTLTEAQAHPPHPLAPSSPMYTHALARIKGGLGKDSL